MTKRVLFVINTLGWGGAESQVIDLALRFKMRGWTVAVATLVKQAERRDELEKSGVQVHSLRMGRGIPDLRAIFRLRALIVDFSPTVVHTHIVHANLLTRLTRPFTSIPVLISSAHSVNEGARWREVAYRLTDSLTDLTTNVSEAAVERSIASGASPAHRIQFMPNGIDLHRFQRDESVRSRMRKTLQVDDRFVWLAVGRFQEPKDYPNMIDAVAAVANHAARPQLLIVGEGPLREEMEGRVRQAGIEESVRFLGRREDVSDLMSAADAYVMSSAWEGLPIVLLEAAASGLPIVATDVGGNAEIVLKGRTGELVPAGDSSSLSSSMQRIIECSDEDRRTMGRRSVRYVQATFGIDSIVDRWEYIYQSLYPVG